MSSNIYIEIHIGVVYPLLTGTRLDLHHKFLVVCHQAFMLVVSVIHTIRPLNHADLYFDIPAPLSNNFIGTAVALGSITLAVTSRPDTGITPFIMVT